MSEVLASAIVDVLLGRNPSVTFEVLYKLIYDGVLAGEGLTYYKELKNVIEDHVCNVVVPQLTLLKSDALLSQLVTVWSTFDGRMQKISKLYTFLDLYHKLDPKKRSPGVKLEPVSSLGQEIFKDHMFESGILELASSELVNMINQNRESYSTIEYIEPIVRLLKSIGVFDAIFGDEFLAASSRYYKRKRRELEISPTYCHDVQKTIYREVLNCRVFDGLAEDLVNKTIRIAETELIDMRTNAIVANPQYGLVASMSANNIDNINMLHWLLRRIQSGGRDLLTTTLSNYIGAAGSKLDKGDWSRYIPEFFELRNKIDKQLSDIMKKEESLREKIRGYFQRVLNSNPNAAEQLASYVNRLIIEGGEIDEDVRYAYNLLDSKDVFHDRYWRDLASRLLTSEAGIAEREMRLCNNFDSNSFSTSAKVKEMFSDVEKSDLLNNQQYKSIEKDARFGIDLKVQIIRHGIWPSPIPLPDCVLPSPLVDVFNVFSVYYGAKHYEPRTLTLEPQWGRAIIVGNFYSKDHRQYEFSTTTYQMIILLLFNNRETYSFEEMLTETNFTTSNLESVLVSLEKILSRGDENLSLSDPRQTFSVNDDFVSEEPVVGVPPAAIHPEEPKPSVSYCVEQDRKYELEAAIVRIVKMQKGRLRRDVLITKVKEYVQHRFQPEEKTVVNLIDSLVEREYLKFKKPNFYSYCD